MRRMTCLMRGACRGDDKVLLQLKNRPEVSGFLVVAQE